MECIVAAPFLHLTKYPLKKVVLASHGGTLPVISVLKKQRWEGQPQIHD